MQAAALLIAVALQAPTPEPPRGDRRRSLLADVCGDVPRPAGPPFRCYPMALLRLCHDPERHEWIAVGDATRYVGTYNNHGAEARLHKRLRRRDPLLARRSSWDSDADFVDVSAKSRIDVVALLRELTRTG